MKDASKRAREAGAGNGAASRQRARPEVTRMLAQDGAEKARSSLPGAKRALRSNKANLAPPDPHPSTAGCRTEIMIVPLTNLPLPGPRAILGEEEAIFVPFLNSLAAPVPARPV